MMSLSATRSLLRSAPMRELREAPLGGAGFLARAWAAIFVVEASLNTIGYKRTLAWIEAVPARRARRGRPSAALGEKLVGAAYRAHAFRGGCLPRSLVQYLLHRRDGTAARFVVGVRRGAIEAERRGIEAHAWVESAAAADRSRDVGFEPIFEAGTTGWSPAGASANEDTPTSFRRPGR